MDEEQEPDEALQDELVSLVRGGRKIEAIKRLREASGVDLVEAKKTVDALECEMAGKDPAFKAELESRRTGCAGVLMIGVAIAAIAGKLLAHV